MIPDPKLIEGCLQGKRKAYALLYKRYAATMLGVCLRYGRNLTEAEDVLQEGFIKVFTNLARFRQEGSLEGWIRRIMVNTAVDHYNKQSREGFLLNLEEIKDMHLHREKRLSILFGLLCLRSLFHSGLIVIMLILVAIWQKTT